jgi:hypothetical protein
VVVAPWRNIRSLQAEIMGIERSIEADFGRSAVLPNKGVVTALIELLKAGLATAIRGNATAAPEEENEKMHVRVE